MGGPGSGRKRTLDLAAQPRGARWREVRARVIARDGAICWLCGHGQAHEADHVVPGAVLSGNDYYDEANIRASHGSSCPCPTCGRRCNQQRGMRSYLLQAAGLAQDASLAAVPDASGTPEPEPLSTVPRRIRICCHRSVSIADADRCESCQRPVLAGRQRYLSAFCASGGCEELGEEAQPEGPLAAA